MKAGDIIRIDKLDKTEEEFGLGDDALMKGLLGVHCVVKSVGFDPSTPFVTILSCESWMLHLDDITLIEER